ncbi:MAG: hypothetical protein ACI4L6_04325 [Candidatus Onthoplasma sp.]
MKETKKTCQMSNKHKTSQNMLNKNQEMAKNKNMKNNIENENCNIHVMPCGISDEDISALFNGIVNVVKKKFELDARAEIVSMSSNMSKILKELHDKQAECIRLKNEIVYLNSLLEQKQ